MGIPSIWPTWGLPGCSWGGPGAPLGGPRGALRLSWSHLGAIFVVDNLLIKLCSDFERQGSPKEAPEAPQRDPKNDPRRHQNRVQKVAWKKFILESLSGRSWAGLGLSWAAPGGQNVWFYLGKRGTFEESLFGAQTSSKTPLGANLGQLGRRRGPKGPPRGAQNEPKMDQKRDPKLD